MPKYYRKVIKASAWDSPNVLLAIREREAGLPISNTTVVPGVISWEKLQERLATWDEVLICIGLHGNFYQGAGTLLYPPTWLNRAASPEYYSLCQSHPTEAIGIDPAEGGDKTAMAAVNQYGLKELTSRKTPNTNDVVNEAITFAQKHNVDWSKVCFDMGGGGREHAQRMQANNMNVNMVAFGESPSLRPRRGLIRIEEKIAKKAERYSFKNLRAEMYWGLRERIDPSLNPQGFSLPSLYTELRRQLAPMPLLRSEEGTFYMLPKHNRGGSQQTDVGRVVTQQKSLFDLLKVSPDEADSVVLAIYQMDYEVSLPEAGCF